MCDELGRYWRGRSEKVRRMRKAVRALMRSGHIPLEPDYSRQGAQVGLARHFGVSRQRIHQIVREERG